MIFPSEHPIPHLQVATLHFTVSKSLILHLFIFLLLSMDSWILFFHSFIILYCPYLFWCSDRPNLASWSFLSWLLSPYILPSFSWAILEQFLTLQHNKRLLAHFRPYPAPALKSAIFPRNPGPFTWQDVIRDQDLGTRKIHTQYNHVHIHTHT